jgi:acetyl-CoA carboxylase biotin carboxyl carrier protein
MNIDQIRELARIANENNLESIELQSDNMVLKIRVNPGGAVSYTACKGVGGGSEEAGMAGPANESACETPEPFVHEIKSPMVGVFYAAPAPGSEPYVKVGSRVKKGDVLCIIEAMKLMNEITADKDGEIAKVCVENGQLVEYGQTLFHLS